MENPPRQASLTINWYWTQTLLGPNLAGCYMPGFSLGRWATQPRACSQPISWSTPLGSGIPSSRAILPCGAARGRLRTSRTSAGLSGSACRERSAGMGQRQPHNRAGRCGAGRLRCGQVPGQSRGGPGAVRTGRGVARAGPGAGLGSGSHPGNARRARTWSTRAGRRRAGAAAQPISAALSSVQTGAQWSERRARCSQAWRERRAADGPARQWAVARGSGQPMGALRGRARARLGCPCRVLG